MTAAVARDRLVLVLHQDRMATGYQRRGPCRVLVPWFNGRVLDYIFVLRNELLCYEQPDVVFTDHMHMGLGNINHDYGTLYNGRFL